MKWKRGWTSKRGWKWRRGWLSEFVGWRTLAGRLALGGVAWIALWALGLLLAFNVLLSHVLSGQVDASLRARSEAVSATIQLRGGRVSIAARDDAALDAGTSIYLGQTLVEGDDLSPVLRQRLVQRGERTADREILGPVRYLAAPINSHGLQVATIVVSSDVSARSRTEQIIGGSSVGFIAILLLVTFLALRATVRRAMQPVRAMGDSASAWSDKEIDRRFDPHTGPLELRRLAVTLNALLERIAATVRYERRFTAELSHELRTPLAHLHAEVDLLTASAADPRQRVPIGPDNLDDLLTSIRRLENLVETTLTPARVEQHQAPGLGRIEEVLADLPRPPAGAALLVTHEPNVTLAIESDVARRALLPVLENAWRYAAHEIRIDVAAVDGMALITVSDDGGLLGPNQEDSIFEPGFRGDPSDGYPGAGLGLALTRRICRAAGGDASAAVIAGWTTIRLHLPCVQGLPESPQGRDADG